MPSIRDLVAAIRQREGVEAAVILGRDGLLIDSQSVPGLDAEDLAARIPAIIGPADELGAAANRGPLTTAVLEHQSGLAVVSVLNADAVLFVLVKPQANIGQLLFETLNAFDYQMLRELARACEDASYDDEVRVVVLTGAGRAFCVGANLRSWADEGYVGHEREYWKWLLSPLNVASAPNSVIIWAWRGYIRFMSRRNGARSPKRATDCGPGLPWYQP